MSTIPMPTRQTQQENEKHYRAVCAKLGAENALFVRAGGSTQEIHAQRKEVRRMLNKLTESAIDRAFTNEEFGAIEHATAIVARCDVLIDVAERLQSASVSTDEWRNQQGEKIEVVDRSQKFSDGPNGRNERNDGEFSFGNFLRGMVNAGARSPEIRSALSEGSDAAGGFLTPEFLSKQLIDKMRARQVCIKAGARTALLETDNTRIVRVATDPTVGWRNENAVVAESDPVFEGIVFAPKTLAVLVKVSVELLEDAANMSDALTAIFAGAMGAELDRVALIGSGTAPEPRGIFNTSGIGSVSMGTNGAQITNFTPQLDALKTVRTANAADPTAMILHPRTARTVDGLVDTTGQPLRAPKAIEAIPLLTTTSMPITQTQGASGAVCSSMITGDFTQLLFGLRTNIKIALLREAFMGNLQVGFVCYLRADVQLLQPSAFTKVIGILP